MNDDPEMVMGSTAWTSWGLSGVQQRMLDTTDLLINIFCNSFNYLIIYAILDLKNALIYQISKRTYLFCISLEFISSCSDEKLTNC